MNMKLLDITLIGILAALSATAMAQDGAQAQSAVDEVECGQDGCESDEGVLFRLRTRGDRVPSTRGTGRQSSEEALKPDRRVTIEAESLRSENKDKMLPGQSIATGRFMVDLPGGGVVWATEDPALTTPVLNVQAGASLPFENGRATQPLRFYGYTNYGAFIERIDVLVYRGDDVDRVRPVATLTLPVAATADVSWDAAALADAGFKVGDELQYIARAWGKDGSFDETRAGRVQLVTPQQHDRGVQQMRDGMQRVLGRSVEGDQAQALSTGNAIYGQSALRVQNIPVYGSRVRIFGRDIPAGQQLSINGQPVPVDQERKFVAEFIEPIGQHHYQVQVHGGQQSITSTHTLDVDVTGRYMFLVALADLTLSKNSVSGNVEPLAAGDRFDETMLSEGRLAFYLKGKVRGKYLLTAQADTRERELRDLFDGFLDAYPQDVFRRLDPDLYYPVYGDDSTTYRDVDTQGRFYVRLDWDQNQALWGNFQTDLGGTEYGRYDRSLYGAALRWRSRATNVRGEAKSQLRVFGSQARTAPGHSELLGTGGSLYYLRHTDVLPGSEKVVLEVRDTHTGRIDARVVLERGKDYDMDELQGRIVLTRALSQVTRDNVRTLTRDTPLDGYQQLLLVDYEYVPSGFQVDDVSVGLRGKQWIGEHVAVGATHVDESRGGEDYQLRGADVTLQAGNGTWLKLERHRSTSTAAPIFYSDNGGLDFVRRDPAIAARSGQATALEARANFRELGWTQRDWSAGAWWREVDAGFSVARFDTGQATREYGAEVLGWTSDTLSVFGRYSQAERGTSSLGQAQLIAEWQRSETSRLGVEIKRVREQRPGYDAAATLAALSYHHRLSPSLELYGVGQVTADDDGGAYAKNNLLTVGGSYLFGERSRVGAEVSSGSRGNGAKIDGEYRVGADHTVYGAWTYSTDSTARDPLFDNALQNGWTVGQRWRLTNRSNLFNESQFVKDRNDERSGIAHTFGMDFIPAPGWNAGFTVMDAQLDALSGRVDRRAYSVSGGRSDVRMQWSSKLEYRQDRGAEQREQWVTSNRVAYRVNQDWSLAGRAQFAQTTDELNAAAGTQLAEANLGFAWRPHDNTRWAAFGRFTYLYDVASLGQEGGATYDQRSQVISLEGIHQLDDKWELAGKLASRTGDWRLERGTGPWLDSRADFLAVQLRYHLIAKWEGLAEYRQLKVTQGGVRRGWLVGVDRQLGENFKVGVGYNFTDFSDDLTNLRYDNRGWFLNLAGYY